MIEIAGVIDQFEGKTFLVDKNLLVTTVIHTSAKLVQNVIGSALTNILNITSSVLLLYFRMILMIFLTFDASACYVITTLFVDLTTLFYLFFGIANTTN